MDYLTYRPGDRFSTIACPEPNLQTVEAEKFIKAYDEAYTLEGVNFDRNGDMYFTSTQGYAIWKVDMKTKEILSEILWELGRERIIFIVTHERNLFERFSDIKTIYLK